MEINPLTNGLTGELILIVATIPQVTLTLLKDDLGITELGPRVAIRNALNRFL